MCGIVGIVSNENDSRLLDNIRSMADTLRHRGPDDEGVWLSSESNVAIGHRRLSVIDTSIAGHQPMLSQCGRYVIAFNGEIYNHLSLRNKLSSESDFYSATDDNNQAYWLGHSDTETLLACISEWGVKKTLQASVGMFAFALWDCHKKTLVLARDRFGEKPLYYGWINGSFVFGSELKALRSFPKFNNPINRDVLALYFQHSVIPAPYSIYQDIFKLNPSHFLVIRENKLSQKYTKIEQYWSLIDVAKKGINNPINNEATAIKELDSVLRKSVSQQAVADVPLGAFLSGGVDSSTIVALMQAQSSRPIQTFTVGFDEAGFDESPYALAVAQHLKTDHHTLHVTANDARSIIPKLHELYDEPFADSSQIPTHLVCQAARQHVTVALSGDAGDELFGGYNRYLFGPSIWKKIKWTPLFLRKALDYSVRNISKTTWNSFNDLLPNNYRVSHLGDKAHKLAHRLKSANSFHEFYKNIVVEWPRDVKLVLHSEELVTKLDDMNVVKFESEAEHRMMLWDSLSYLPDDILTKVDRAAMGVSLETRVPFLDHRVVDLAWSLPLHMKIRDGQGKWALRQVLYKYVPRELIERPKAGFSMPIGQWLRGPLCDWAETLLETSRLRHEGYLNVELVRQVWQEHLSGKFDWTTRLWSILMFQSWLEDQK
jgi:asparagine synthase (glutamine-hydrolysing)